MGKLIQRAFLGIYYKCLKKPFKLLQTIITMPSPNA